MLVKYIYGGNAMNFVTSILQTVFGPIVLEKVSRVLEPGDKNSKGLLQSKTFNGLSMVVSAFVSSYFGVGEELLGEAAGYVETISVASGSLLSVYGRVKAEKSIGPN